MKQILSKVPQFQKPQLRFEQYRTEPAMAADLLWLAHIRNSLRGRSVLDMGCGTGMFAIGAAVLGAKVTAIDIDGRAIDQGKAYQKTVEALLDTSLDILWEVRSIDQMKTDRAFSLCFSNPPFGMEQKGKNLVFLEKAIASADLSVFLLHRGEGDDFSFYKKFIGKSGGCVVELSKGFLKLPQTYWYHTSRIQSIPLWVCWIAGRA